jgi:methionyl-tRNA formyltransferase
MIAILTTKSLHHNYFIKSINDYTKNLIVIYEKKIIKPRFNIFHPFEKKREFYEKNLWKNNILNKKELNIYYVNNINSKIVQKILYRNKCTHIFVFGTQKINCHLFKKYKNKMYNLHGGDTEKYRGLDSHYWSIYHNDFPSILTTLHLIDKNLDTGKIIYKIKINLKSVKKIQHLRSVNTEACILLAKRILDKIKNKKRILFYKPKSLGRYYSFMPYDLKNIVEKKFKLFKKND